MIRTFIALDLPREAINEIRKIQNILKKKNLFRGKFTEPENLHLTLKFLGEIPSSVSESKLDSKNLKQPETENSCKISSLLKNNEENAAEAVITIEEVKKRLREIRFEDFSVEFGEVGVFSKSFIKIIWIKLNGKGIFKLQKEIDSRLRNLFEEEKRFMSHLTIARVKEVYGDKKEFLKYLESIKPRKVSFRVDKFFLKKSELKENGPVYEDLEEYVKSEK